VKAPKQVPPREISNAKIAKSAKKPAGIRTPRRILVFCAVSELDPPAAVLAAPAAVAAAEAAAVVVGAGSSIVGAGVGDFVGVVVGAFVGDFVGVFIGAFVVGTQQSSALQLAFAQVTSFFVGSGIISNVVSAVPSLPSPLHP